jgi:hypothetical protein
MAVVVVSAQVPRDVREELEARAVAADRSLSAEIRRVLVRSLKHDDEEDM